MTPEQTLVVMAVGIIVMAPVISVGAVAIAFYQDIVAIRQKEPEIVIKRGPRTVAISDLTSQEVEKLIQDMEQIKQQMLSTQTGGQAS